MRAVISVCVAAVLVSRVVLRETHDKEHGLKFVCGEDICSYPWQFCSQEEERCRYCSKDVCHSSNIPAQCQDACQELPTSVTSARAASANKQTPPPVDDLACQTTGWRETIGVLRDISILIVVLILAIQALLTGWFGKGGEKYTSLKERPDKDADDPTVTVGDES
ncbi:hypothetical protein ScPMuIL_003807 [Solemya velum]